MNASLRSETLQPRPAALAAEWRNVATHTHFLRSKETDFEGAKQIALAWCRKHAIAAAGLGSPWEPVSAARYGRCEREDRDAYYGGRLDPAGLMDREPIASLFADLNRRGEGRILFYQDNENPKGRFGHLWWFGYCYDFPAWHDYSQDRPVQYTPSHPPKDMNALTGRPHRRRSYLEIVATQRRAGALGIWAHPTSWWLDGQGGFVTNIAAEMPLHFWADGRVDGAVVSGYDACHRGYQQTWFRFLDTGGIVPGFAETDHCFDQKKLLDHATSLSSMLRVRGALTAEALRDAARTGECCFGTGGFLHVSADGTPMGRVQATAAGTIHRVRVEAYPRPGESCFSRLDLVGKGGALLARRERFAGGILEYEIPGADAPHYVLVLGFGETEDPEAPRQQSIRHLAISNPVYLHPRGFSLQPMSTEVEFRCGAANPYLGGDLLFQDAAGAPLEQRRLAAGSLRVSLPASTRAVVQKPGLRPLDFHIALENPAVRGLVEFLAQGEFRSKTPGLSAGEVPAEAFRLSEMRQALERVAIDLDALGRNMHA